MIDAPSPELKRVPTYVDRLSNQIDLYLQCHGHNTLSERIADLAKSYDLKDREEAATRESTAFLLNDAINRAKDLDRIHTLFLFRRIPVFGGLSEPLGSDPCVMQAIIFGTNIISSIGKKHSGRLDRFSILNRPVTDTEIEATLGLYAICLLHSFFLFKLNTHVRAYDINEEKLHILTDSYNRRANQRHEDQRKRGNAAKGIILAGFSPISLNPDKRIVEHRGPGNLSAIVMYRNYVPYCVDLQPIEILYRHLEGNIFKENFHLRYSNWLSIYKAMNAVLADHLISQSRPRTISRMSDQQFMSAVEREDDFSQGGVAIIDRDSLANSVFASRSNMRPAQSFTRNMVDTFISVHTLQAGGPFDSFPESHYCFYEIDETRVIIDYVRLGSLLPVMRRIMTPLLGAAGKTKSKGNSFEALVCREIKSKLPSARAVTSTIKRRVHRRDVFEADVGFVIDDLLVVIDAKYYTKPKTYLDANRNNVTNRKNKIIRLIDYLDSQIDDNIDWLVSQWPDLDISKVLPVVCTAEPEFIATDDPKYWLKFPRTPRACTLPELLKFFGNSNWLAEVSESKAVRWL